MALYYYSSLAELCLADAPFQRMPQSTDWHSFLQHEVRFLLPCALVRDLLFFLDL